MSSDRTITLTGSATGTVREPTEAERAAWLARRVNYATTSGLANPLTPKAEDQRFSAIALPQPYDEESTDEPLCVGLDCCPHFVPYGNECDVCEDNEP